MSLEVSIEEYLDKRVKALGGVTRKLQYRGRQGAPDRLCILPDRVLFIEVKRPKGGRFSEHQRKELSLLRSAGALAFTVKNRQEIDQVLGK